MPRPKIVDWLKDPPEKIDAYWRIRPKPVASSDASWAACTRSCWSTAGSGIASQIVAASSSLVLIGGIGASLGPTLAATVMAVIGPPGFFVTLTGIHLAVGGFAIYRMGKREAVPMEEQGPNVPVVSGAVTGIGQLSTKIIRNHMDHDLAAMSRSQMRRR